MKLITSLLLGSAAGLVGVAGAQAADLPTRKSAPVEYVRICDAYGAGFFYIPGTDTCLKVGGLVLAEYRALTDNFSVGIPYAAGAAKGGALSTGAYINGRTRDTTGFGALGRLELDARNATAWGTLRAFARVDSYYGAGSTASTGSGSQGGGYQNNPFNTTAGPSASRYTTILNKAFIQFAGLTAGYAQSMFDFYADAYNWAGLRGSNATSALLAYTATFGGGFSATISVEDQQSRRVAIGTTNVGSTAYPGGSRLPDIVANLRVDQPWGAVQLSGAAHQLRPTQYLSTAGVANVSGVTAGTATITPAFPTATNNSFGFAAQLGVQFNLDNLSPGDKLWLQAGYESGAISYIDGSNLVFALGAPSFDRYPGNVTPGYGVGYNHGSDFDCVFTGGACEKQNGYAIVASYKHYWIPTLSSTLFGSFMRINYTANSAAGAGGAIGVPSWQETVVGTNLIWTPIKGFDIGGEFSYIRSTTLGGSPLNNLTGANYGGAGFPALPAYAASTNIFQGRLRVQRAF